MLEKNNIFNYPPTVPFVILEQWINEARAKKLVQPGAMALATSNVSGHTSNRIVQLLDIKSDKLIFATHSNSQKGKDIDTTGWVSALLYWRETSQQIIASGITKQLSSKESDELWAKRSKDTYPMSIASKQSETLYDEDELRRKAFAISTSQEGLIRPDNWLGYAINISTIEFWQGAKDRLHQRLRYEFKNDSWSNHRLQP